MWYNYFERAVEYERKRDEDRRVYAMLAATTETHAPLHGLRVAIGHRMMHLGARLAGESVHVTVPYLADKQVLSQNN